MHETGMIRGLINQIEKIANDNGGKKIKSVKIKIGALANITASHFTEHFVAETPGTIAEGAKLEVVQMTDIKDLNAQDILIESIEVTE